MNYIQKVNSALIFIMVGMVLVSFLSVKLYDNLAIMIFVLLISYLLYVFYLTYETLKCPNCGQLVDNINLFKIWSGGYLFKRNPNEEFNGRCEKCDSKLPDQEKLKWDDPFIGEVLDTDFLTFSLGTSIFLVGSVFLIIGYVSSLLEMVVGSF